MKARQPHKGSALAGQPVRSAHLPMWRSKLIVFFLFIAFVVLIVRVFWIQGPGNDFYQKQGESRYQRTLELSATRGKIFDRNGVVLATSLPVRAIWAIPEDVPDIAYQKMAALSKLLSISTRELRTKLSVDRNFVYIKRQVSIEIADKVAALNIPGIYQRKEYKRFYPEGEIAAHLIGFTNVEDQGQEGIELGMQQQLASVPGSRRVIKDRMGRIVEDVDELVTPRDGKDLTLSVDTKIQYIAYTALKAAVERNKAHAGAAIVLDARTGEVLALVNFPTYNPNNRARLSGEQLRNRVLTDTFEPGSIMKPFTISLALDLSRVTSNTLVNTSPGRYKLDRATISDTRDFGTLTVAGVIQKSSNIGTTKIAMQLQPEEMWNMFTSVGFGQAPQIGFPGAVSGRLRPWKNWRRIEQATMSYGYGISVSLFQVARAYTIFAHDGQLLPVTIFKQSNEEIMGPQIISPKIARTMRMMLASVVAPGGGAVSAQVPGYRVGGKTGTAYKSTAHGYDKSRYRSSFVGIAPIDSPRLIIAVSLDEPSAGKHLGGQVAGPIFAQIASDTLRALNVSPDQPVRPIVTFKQNAKQATNQLTKATIKQAANQVSYRLSEGVR